jgi:hypothetical protein
VQGLDRYAYVNNSPVMYADPSGHQGSYKDFIAAQKMAEHDPSINVLICGDDVGVPCGEGGVLDPYYREGDLVINCGQLNKEECKDEVKGQIEDELKKNPSLNFVLIGHSKGADVAILTARWMVNAGYKKKIDALVLLDPSLSWTNYRFKREEGLEGILATLVHQGVRIIAANSASYKPKSDEATFLRSLSGSNYTYLGLYSYKTLGVKNGDDAAAHMALATNQTVYSDVMSALYPIPINAKLASAY